MKILYNHNEIELINGDNNRPEKLIINGEEASMSRYLNEYGYNWKSTASGNALFYMTETGKKYQIPQARLLNTFQDELRELSQKTGLTQKALAEKIGVPLRTYEEWRAGRRTPTDFVKATVLMKIKAIIEENYTDDDIEKVVIAEAKKYSENEYQLFEDEYGWHDWMNRYTTAEDGEECTEEEIEEINKILRKCFNKAHE